jgi:hypothetical protein
VVPDVDGLGVDGLGVDGLGVVGSGVVSGVVGRGMVGDGVPVSRAVAARVRAVVRASAWRFSRVRGSGWPSRVLWGRAPVMISERRSSAFSLAR